MKKKKAILNFAGIIFVCVLLVVLSVFRFFVPNSSDEYIGFLRAINLGIDFKGGTTLVINAKNTNTDSVNFSVGVNAHANRIQKILDDYNYDGKVYQVAGNNLRIELYDEYNTEEIMDLISILPANNTISMRAEEDTSAQVYLTEDDLMEIYAMENSYYGYSSSASKYGVYIKFTAAGREKFKELTTAVAAKSDNKNVYIYIGDSLFQTVPVSEAIDQDYIFINGISQLNTLDGANQYAGQLLSTKYDFDFEKVSQNIIAKADAKRSLILACSISGAIVLICLIVLIVKFKKLGLVNALALFVGLLLQIILLQAVPDVVLSSTALVGSVITFVLGFIMVYYMLEKIKQEYSVGKKAHSSFKFGFQKNYKTQLEISISYLVACIIFYIFGSLAIKYFALASIIGIVVYGFSAILIAKWFNNMCFDLYLEKVENYGFTREAHINELEKI